MFCRHRLCRETLHTEKILCGHRAVRATPRRSAIVAPAQPPWPNKAPIQQQCLTKGINLEYDRIYEDSRDRKSKWKFVVGKGMIVKCLDMAILQMKKGSTSIVKCPPELAYGNERWHGGIPDGSTLIYEIVINDFERPSSK